MRKILFELLGIVKRGNEAQELHKRTLKEIEQTTKKIEQMNKILVKNSVAYKIYIAAGGEKV